MNLLMRHFVMELDYLLKVIIYFRYTFIIILLDIVKLEKIIREKLQ